MRNICSSSFIPLNQNRSLLFTQKICISNRSLYLIAVVTNCMGPTSRTMVLPRHSVLSTAGATYPISLRRGPLHRRRVDHRFFGVRLAVPDGNPRPDRVKRITFPVARIPGSGCRTSAILRVSSRYAKPQFALVALVIAAEKLRQKGDRGASPFPHLQDSPGTLR